MTLVEKQVLGVLEVERAKHAPNPLMVYPLSVEDVAKAAGISEDVAGQALKRLVSLGNVGYSRATPEVTYFVMARIVVGKGEAWRSK